MIKYLFIYLNKEFILINYNKTSTQFLILNLTICIYKIIEIAFKIFVRA